MNTNVMMRSVAISSKRCITCLEEKPLESFHKNIRMADGRLNKCSSCVYLYTKAWRKENPEARAKEYAKWQDEQRKIRNFVPMRDGLDPVKQKVNRKNYAHRRRARTKGVMNEFDRFMLEECVDLVATRTDKTGLKWELDHIIPLNHKSASGLHNGFNFQVVPASWNYKKGNRNMDSFWPIKPLGSIDGR